MMDYVNKKLKRKDDAISPVIGTILMVAATVIIAGAVYAAVNAYNGKSAKTAPDAAFKAQALDTNGNGLEDMIKITYLSGPSGQSSVAIAVASSGTNTVSAVKAAPSSWSPGDYATYDAACAPTPCTSAAGSYFVTVSFGDSTLLDQTLQLKE